jgi:hypothetical protein
MAGTRLVMPVGVIRLAAPASSVCHTSHTKRSRRDGDLAACPRPGSAERGASIRRLYDLPILDRLAALIAGRTGSVGATTMPVPAR